jgi:hypothetical protein
MAYAIDIDSVNLGSNPSPPASHFGLHWRLPDRPTGLFSLRSAELIQRLFMQEANLSQVSLRFRNVVPYDTQLFPDCNLARMMQGSFKALDAKRSTSGKGISLLYVSLGRSDLTVPPTLLATADEVIE